MNFGNELIFFFSALGTFNAVILSIYFFLLAKKKYLTNYFLGSLIFAYSIRTGTMVFVYFDATIPRIYLQIGLSACLFIGPLLYFFLKAAILGTNSMKRSWKILLSAHLAFVVIVGLSFPYQQYEIFWNQYLVYIIYAQWLLFIMLSSHILWDKIAKLFKSKEKLSGQEGWLVMIYFANVLIFSFYLLSILRTPYTSCLNGSIVFSFMLYLIVSILLYRKNTDDLFNFIPEKVNTRIMEAALANELIQKMEQIMSQQKVFRNPDLKLGGLAKLLNVSSHQLSQLLNENLENNFTTYVNSYRIEEACSMLLTDNRLTLEAVGYEVGFNSKSTFFTAFKKHVGMTPLSYQQQAVRSLGSDL